MSNYQKPAGGGDADRQPSFLPLGMIGIGEGSSERIAENSRRLLERNAALVPVAVRLGIIPFEFQVLFPRFFGGEMRDDVWAIESADFVSTSIASYAECWA